jgi:hypothetical protein
VTLTLPANPSVTDILAEKLGCAVGWLEGCRDGCLLGWLVGWGLGTREGCIDG